MHRGAIIAILVAAAFGAQPQKQPAEGLAEYLAGVELLRDASGMSSSAKAAAYRELTAITGISGARAAQLVAGYKGRPKEWGRVREKVRAILDTRDSTAAAAKPAADSAKAPAHHQGPDKGPAAVKEGSGHG